MSAPRREVGLEEVLEAIQDQSRILLALSGDFATKTEAAKRLGELSIPPVRIAALLNIPASQVRSALAKARKRAAAVGESADIEKDVDLFSDEDSGDADAS